MQLTGRIDIRATALEPIVHGAGTSGNTQLLRQQEIQLPDGTLARVPFVSGNSVKHRLRAAAVQYALDAMAVEDHTLSKAEVDLLFSGGHLSKSGAAVDLEQARQLEALFPPLSLCGYSAGNTMTESKIRVSHLHLVCRENAWRVPDDLREHPALTARAGALISDEFGTRHDQARTHIARRLLTEEAGAAVVRKKTKQLKEPTSDGPAERGDSAQMIYDFSAIAAGATLWGSIQVADLTELEQAALSSAFHYASTDRRGDSLVMGVGAKNAIGYGALKIELRGQIRVAPPQYVESAALTVAGDTLAARYTAHMRERRAEILAALRQAVS
jgi:hypothetical protein